jgi:hypothetical protein
MVGDPPKVSVTPLKTCPTPLRGETRQAVDSYRLSAKDYSIFGALIIFFILFGALGLLSGGGKRLLRMIMPPLYD